MAVDHFIARTLATLFTLIIVGIGYIQCECKEPGPAVNAYRFVNGESYNTGGTVNYSCYMNHVRVAGGFSLTCLSTGRYDNSPPVCNISCGAPLEIAKTERILNHSLNDSITYQCKDNHSITVTGQCDKLLGRWVVPFIACSDGSNWARNRETTQASPFPYPTSNGVDGDRDTVFQLTPSSPSWTVAIMEGTSLLDVHQVKIFIKSYKSVEKLTVTVELFYQSITTCAVVNSSLLQHKELDLSCPNNTYGSNVSLSAVFDSTQSGSVYVDMVEVEVYGKIRTGDCGIPPFVYGADAQVGSTRYMDRASYYCLSQLKFINILSGSTSDSVCLHTGLWSTPSIQCKMDERVTQPTDLECLLSEEGEEYIGKVNQTISGASCELWDQVPHSEEMNFPDQDGSYPLNYCRNPTTESRIFSPKERPWCWVHNYAATEFCPIIQCDELCAVSGDGFEYRGTISTAANGESCDRWDTSAHFSPDVFSDGRSNHSFCRNPGRSQSSVWCYVKNGGREPCALPLCPRKFHELTISKDEQTSYWMSTFMVWKDNLQHIGQNLDFGPKFFGSSCHYSPNVFICHVTNCSGTQLGFPLPQWTRVTINCNDIVSSTTPYPTTFDLTSPEFKDTQTTFYTRDTTQSRAVYDSINGGEVSPSTVNSLTQLVSVQLNQSSPGRVCTCGCEAATLTQSQVTERIDQVKQELTVKRKTLSSSVRRLSSAVDNRLSAASIGYLGIILLVATFVIIVLPDAINLVHHLVNLSQHNELYS